MAKHRSGVPETLLLVIKQSVLIRRSYTTGSALGTQAQVVAIAVVEAVHFFLDDVGNLADGTLEQFSLFQHRKTNLLIAEAPDDSLENPFQVLPAQRLLGKDVIHSPDCL